jgi:adenine/guanine phosphoribosyltransferase-like PRPP-binding protein
MKSNKQRLSWDSMLSLVMSICSDIETSKIKFNRVVGVHRGGLVPAVMVSHALDIDMMTIKPNDVLPFRRAELEKTLIIDDIYDTGATLRSIMANNAGVKCAALIHNINLPDLDFYGCKQDLENWVVFPWEIL